MEDVEFIIIHFLNFPVWGEIAFALCKSQWTWVCSSPACASPSPQKRWRKSTASLPKGCSLSEALSLLLPGAGSLQSSARTELPLGCCIEPWSQVGKAFWDPQVWTLSQPWQVSTHHGPKCCCSSGLHAGEISSCCSGFLGLGCYFVSWFFFLLILGFFIDISLN